MLHVHDHRQWNYATARHLLNRAGFGASPGLVRRFAAMGLHKAVETIVEAPPEAGALGRPEWAHPESLREIMRSMRGATDQERRQARREFARRQRRNLADLTGRWLDWMRRSPDPLREKFALFLHGHFATSAEKVRDAYLLWQQNELFRNRGLGDFRQLTKDVSRDPAMLVYLDAVRSKLTSPNENFAREVMELFTLGEGNYSERDVREAARAFTGYRIKPESQRFWFIEGMHDDGRKEILGRSGKFSGDDVIDLIFEQPRAAEFLARKIWEFFVYENPDEPLVTRLAATFRGFSYDSRRLLWAIFRSREFYSERAMATQIKSPVQWLVQACNELECELPEPTASMRALARMGQELFKPPNVKGWDGGRSWINSSTLLFRYNLAAAFTGAAAKGRDRMPKVEFAALLGKALDDDAAAVVDSLGARFYGGDPGGRERQAFVGYWVDNREHDRAAAVSGLAQLMMSTPRYQLC